MTGIEKLNLLVDNKIVDLDYITKAVRFYIHLENHKEVKESKENKGVPICKICGLTGIEINHGKDILLASEFKQW